MQGRLGKIGLFQRTYIMNDTLTKNVTTNIYAIS